MTIHEICDHCGDTGHRRDMVSAKVWRGVSMYGGYVIVWYCKECFIKAFKAPECIDVFGNTVWIKREE